mgnify:CR=1 FL=1
MNVTHRMQIGATLMLLAKFMERGLGLISTVILARLLLPGDFGMVAMAAPIVMFIELLRSFSFDVALILHGNEPQATPLAYLSGAEFRFKLPNDNDFRFLLSNTVGLTC